MKNAKNLLREYVVELSGGILIFAGLLAIMFRKEIFRWVKGVAQAIVPLLQRSGKAIGRSLTDFSPADLLGLLLIGAGIVFIVWRVRTRFQRQQGLRPSVCPRCGGTLHRTHRSRLDRFLTWAFLPHGRRYTCSSCGWSGIRQSRSQIAGHFLRPGEQEAEEQNPNRPAAPPKSP